MQKMNVLMVGVDKSSIGGMLTVAENYWKSKFFCEKTNLRYIPSVINRGLVMKIVFFIFSFFRIALCILCRRIDLVHIHMAERTSVYREGCVARLSKILGCKVVIHMHGADIETWYEGLSSWRKKIARYFIGGADKVIVLGENWRSFMEKLVQRKDQIEVVYNAVYVPSQNIYNLDAKNIIFLGMIISRKGIIDLLDALKLINQKLPNDIKVLLYGSDKNNNIKSLISERNLDNRVTFCGWLDGEKKVDCFRSAMINVLPSYHEGLPMSILETMAYGIPNITTSIAAIPEVVSDGENGFLITPGDVESLAQKILVLSSDKNLRRNFSRKSYETISENFAVDEHLNQILALYDGLLN